MRISLRKALLIFGLVAALLPTMAMVGVIFAMQRETVAGVEREFENIAAETARQVVSDVLIICEAIDVSMRKTAEDARARAMAELRQMGEPRLAQDFYTTTVRDQNDSRIASVAVLSKLAFGAQTLTPALDADGRASASDNPVQKALENAKGVENVELTIFQRMNPEDGDMLRVATTVLRKDGAPYIGTYIPAIEQDGRANPIISKVLSGGAYRGFSDTEDMSFVTTYEPIFDKDRNVIGMISYGMSGDFSGFISDYLHEQRVGKNGFVWVVESGTPGRMRVKVSQSGPLDDAITQGTERSASRIRMERFIEGAKNLPQGHIGLEKYTPPSADAASQNDVIAAYAYFEPWAWVIGVNAYKRDYAEKSALIGTEADKLLGSIWKATLLLIALVAALSWKISADISAPFAVLARLTKNLKNGDVDAAERSLAQIFEGKKGGEKSLRIIARLGGKMIKNFRTLAARISSGVLRLEENSEAARENVALMEDGFFRQDAEISDAADTAEKVASSSGKLSEEAESSARRAYGAVELARGGIQSLSALAGNSDNLTESAGAIASRLSIMGQKAQSIRTAVSDIGAISEKTNMLSLNAAIEASKSGEFGRGFEGVATQIRNLADQTAAATMRIRSMVRNMQGSIDSASKDVGLFSEGLTGAYAVIRDSDESLSKIIVQLGQLGPKFEALTKGALQQSESAAHISDGLQALDAVTQDAKLRLDEFKDAAAGLQETSEAMKSMASHFKTAP